MTMSNPKTAKRKQTKGQTVLGDYFIKPNKSNKSGNSTVKGNVKLSSPGNESKAKVEDKKSDKTSSKVVKKTEESVEKKVGEEKRPSLKRKVTGAGMFTFSWTRGAQRDTEQYRNGYPDKEDDPSLNDNFDFYMNKISSVPDGDYIDKIHVDWWGDYKRLEVHHGYIQWLFPIRESGLNWHAQELQLHEIKKLQRNKKAMKRILTSYKMMLNFYGMKLDNEDDGTIVREDNWKERFRHLNRSYHNYLRITRILKCLGEFGYEHLKKNFVKFILYEGLVEGTLSNVIDSCVKYWIGVLKEDDDREEVFDYYEKLMQDESNLNKRRNRSPSPPSYSYWSSKADDTESDKKVVSKTEKVDKKDEVDGDVDNESTEDETLYYAMSLIDEDLPEENNSKNNKTRKDHEISDSGEDEDNVEESQEMIHWNKEKEANAEEIEGGSECDDSAPGKVSNADTDCESKASEKGNSHEDIVKQVTDDKNMSNEDSKTINEEEKSSKENEIEKKDEESTVVNEKGKDENKDGLAKNCNGNSGLDTEEEKDNSGTTNHEEMDVSEADNTESSNSDHVPKNVEEKSIEPDGNTSSKSSGEVETIVEENMET